MQILVIGGSYFLGKSFVKMAAKDHIVSVFNRGNRPFKDNRIRQFIGDRHDANALAKLKGQSFDAVVDFCAYQKGDIAQIFAELDGSFKQYIFVSTCDVYERGLQQNLDENAPFERRNFGGEAGDYIAGKVALEEELMKASEHYRVPYTSIRPAFIYGPDNYAPREGIYFHWISQAGQILHPVDATGQFQLVYVEDVAKALLNAIGNRKAFGKAYNLAPIQMETYDSFADALAKSVDTAFERIPVTVDMVQEKGIMLPFPLTKEESNRYDGRKALELIESYTELTEGLKKTIVYK